MMKFTILLALAVAASAAYSGCFVQEDFTCVKQNAVECGGDICFGHCATEFKESCDTKVWYETVCEEEDFCKEIKTACGHDGNDADGLFCGYNEECISDKKCKLIHATKKKSYVGWKSKSVGGGYFEVCKDTFTCAAIDPFDMDPAAIEVVCKEKYKIDEDMDCPTLFETQKIWGGLVMSETKFYKMNAGFSCKDNIVGKTICIEATAKIKEETCGDGQICEAGSECATRETCSEVAAEEPVCAKKVEYTCLTDGTGASLCGNNVCYSDEKCEIVSTQVCPTLSLGP
ncbi:hypothetical protein BSKO_13862 [Bryopsis sp. KO-2023]|nr:hypothetical protein BSKO_13862 [Bryopsis sp. KO-2023]